MLIFSPHSGTCRRRAGSHVLIFSLIPPVPTNCILCYISVFFTTRPTLLNSKCLLLFYCCPFLNNNIYFLQMWLTGLAFLYRFILQRKRFCTHTHISRSPCELINWGFINKIHIIKYVSAFYDYECRKYFNCLWMGTKIRYLYLTMCCRFSFMRTFYLLQWKLNFVCFFYQKIST